MSDRDYLEGSRWEWAYLIECETCGWYTLSQDYGWTKNAGRVHTNTLAPDHELISEDPRTIRKN